ncbi:MAG TPA: hypothetical protein VK723_02310 [Thermoplasmata archaeon]|nr:hypothetical protein [Thermoplasmata archaeon]
MSLRSGEPGPGRDQGASGTSQSRTWRAIFVGGYSGAGVLLVGAASRSTQILAIRLSAQFGLLQLLPPAYWAGMGLIGVAMVLAFRQRSEILIVLTGMLFLAIVAGTPSLFEPNPRYFDTYLHFSEAQAIQSTGHLPAGALGEYSANWPGVFLLDSVLSNAVGSPPMEFLKAYPFIAGALTFLAIFVFIRSTFPRHLAPLATVLASLFAVWAQYHLSPQSLGFVLVLLVMSVMWRRPTRWRGVSALLFVGLVTMHPTSTLILLSILAALSILSFFPRKAAEEVRQNARFTRRVSLLYGTMWFAWLYFRATGSSQAAETAIVTRIGSLISLPENTVNLATSRTAENLYTLAPFLRTGTLGIYGLLALPSLAILWRRETSRPLARFVLAGLLGLAVIGGADILGFKGQFYDRCLLLFSVLAPAICLTGLGKLSLPKIGHRAIVAVLIAASLAAASTVYYQESFNHVTDQSIAVADFLQRAPPRSIVYDGSFPVPVWIPPEQRTPLVRVTFSEIYPTPLEKLGGTAPSYVVFDPTANLWYRQWRGVEAFQYYSDERESHSIIYDNGMGVIVVVGG